MKLLTKFTLALLSGLSTCFPQVAPIDEETKEQVNSYIDSLLNTQTTKAPQNCKCVPFYLCKDGKLNTNGGGVIDLRATQTCPNSNETCCMNPLDHTTPPFEKAISRPDCGRGISQSRILGQPGNEAHFGEFSWMVIVFNNKKEPQTPKTTKTFGGSLIHPHVVLTVAHRVAKLEPHDLTVRAGEWDLKTTSEVQPHQERSIVKIIIHEEFERNLGNAQNGIALLVTDVPFEITDHVNIVCLPKQDEVFLDKNCLASGWGKDAHGIDGKTQSILKKVQLPMVERNQCQSRLRESRLGADFELHDSFVCAGGVLGKDTCTGDGGSPLVCPIPEKLAHYQQVGIVAWGVGCGDEMPAVYINTAKFRNWIDGQMSKLQYTPEY